MCGGVHVRQRLQRQRLLTHDSGLFNESCHSRKSDSSVVQFVEDTRCDSASGGWAICQFDVVVTSPRRVDARDGWIGQCDDVSVVVTSGRKCISLPLSESSANDNFDFDGC